MREDTVYGAIMAAVVIVAIVSLTINNYIDKHAPVCPAPAKSTQHTSGPSHVHVYLWSA